MHLYKRPVLIENVIGARSSEKLHLPKVLHNCKQLLPALSLTEQQDLEFPLLRPCRVRGRCQLAQIGHKRSHSIKNKG